MARPMKTMAITPPRVLKTAMAAMLPTWLRCFSAGEVVEVGVELEEVELEVLDVVDELDVVLDVVLEVLEVLLVVELVVDVVLVELVSEEVVAASVVVAAVSAVVAAVCAVVAAVSVAAVSVAAVAPVAAVAAAAVASVCAAVAAVAASVAAFPASTNASSARFSPARSGPEPKTLAEAGTWAGWATIPTRNSATMRDPFIGIYSRNRDRACQTQTDTDRDHRRIDTHRSKKKRWGDSKYSPKGGWNAPTTAIIPLPTAPPASTRRLI